MKIVHTNRAPEAIGPYSQAVIFQGMVFTSGQIAINPATGAVEESSIQGQSEQVMKNLGAILEEAGSGFGKVLKTTCFLRNMEDFSAFNQVYGKYFAGHKPARSCVAARELPKGVLVEVEAVAAVSLDG